MLHNNNNVYIYYTTYGCIFSSHTWTMIFRWNVYTSNLNTTAISFSILTLGIYLNHFASQPSFYVPYFCFLLFLSFSPTHRDELSPASINQSDDDTRIITLGIIYATQCQHHRCHILTLHHRHGSCHSFMMKHLVLLKQWLCLCFVYWGIRSVWM